jgi:hypothetical protein
MNKRNKIKIKINLKKKKETPFEEIRHLTKRVLPSSEDKACGK